MKKMILAVSIMSVGTMLQAAPVVEPASVNMQQNTLSREVTISYTLSGESGIVTLDILTNGVSIGGTNINHLAGDVNKVVGTGDRMIKWRPDKSWPGQKIADGSVTARVTAWAKDTPPDYMVVELVAGGTKRFYTDAGFLPDGGLTNLIYKSERLVLRKIPAANVQWRMGSSQYELGSADYRSGETPHLITLTNDYYIGVFPVTMKQYKTFYGTKAPVMDFWFSTYEFSDYLPAAHTSFELLRGQTASYDWPANGHAVASDSVIGKLRSVTGIAFDLPTDAQWEFACRAGTGTALNTGLDLSNATACDEMSAAGWYEGNSVTDGAKHPRAVGLKAVNSWGLYDMHGNVWEQCLDWAAAMSAAAVVEPVGPAAGTQKVFRGGSYWDTAFYSRSAFRLVEQGWAVTGAGDNMGFRVCCPVGVE